jgi:signal transduction histidine kinase
VNALQLADPAVGLVAATNGIVVLARRGRHPVGFLLVAVSATWFAGTVASGALFLHRGPMIHLHLSYPTGQLRRWGARVAVVAGYAWAVVDGWVDEPQLTAVVAVVVAVAAVDTFAQTTGPARRAGVAALVAALLFAGVLGLGAANELRHWDADYAIALAYDAVMVTVTTWLTIDLLRGRWTDETLADLVTQLGGGTSDLQTSLRRAVGDPTLLVGHRDDAVVLDTGGRVVDLADRTVTPVLDDGLVVAVLVHDPALAADEQLLAGALEATRLSVVNGLLRTDMAVRARTLVAARRRLLEVRDDQRRLLQRAIADGPVRDLDAAIAALGGLADRDVADRLSTGVVEAKKQLDAFASGLGPEAGDLAASLRTLVGRFHLPVHLAVDECDLRDPVAKTVWFVCAEALTNAVKHAGATRLEVEVRRLDDQVQVRVSDDGQGGADSSGSGIQGLADRVAAHGGVLQVQSGPGLGTIVSAVVPTETTTGSAQS